MKKNLLFVALMLLGMQTTFAQTTDVVYLGGVNDNGYAARVKYATDAHLDAKMNGAENYTIEIWFKTDTDNDFHDDDLVRRFYQWAVVLYQDANKRLYFTHYPEYGTGGSNTYVNTVNDAFIPKQWNHFAVINDHVANTCKIYVNGVNVTKRTVDEVDYDYYESQPLNTNPEDGHATYGPNMYIGYGGGGAEFHGSLSKYRFSTVARDITTLNTTDVDAGFYAMDAETAILMAMDEGTGDVTVDYATDTEAELQNGAIWVKSDYEPVLSISNIATTEFKLYPNPAVNNMVSVQARLGESINKIELFNVVGKSVNVIELKGAREASLNLQGLTNGIYFVKTSTNVGVATQKLVIK